MTRWMYVSNGGYDFVVKIEDGIARYLTETPSFPNACQEWWNSTEAEKKNKIGMFMESVITNDYSTEWDECDANEILDGIEKDPTSRILWERESTH